ncbi:MAG: hypothetical protein KAT35_04730, partial [Candidatus Aenigmarchaeota archaeon]|nr:hypothetical protein [Candidatus Aenigmarchaeota archaeon]
MLKGVFFLGSALPFDKSVTSTALKNVKHIINYYSLEDTTLGKFYESQEGVKSGGEAGFKDKDTFLNLETFYDHDGYVELIYPICNIILYQEGSINLLGQYMRKPTKDVGNKKWHSIYMVPANDAKSGTFCIQFKNNR